MIEEKDELKNEPVKQLLIVGNGFDIQIGLPSLYKDYYDSLTDEQKSSNLLTTLATNQLYNWTDVESLLLKILLVVHNSDTENLQDTPSPRKSGITAQSKEDKDIKEELVRFLEVHCRFRSLSREEQRKEKIYEIIMEQVTNFENSFKSYLKSKIEEFPTEDYEARSQKFLDSLLNSGVYRPNNSEYDNWVISFNYTPIPKTKRLLSFYTTNVHGSLDEEVILGIDAHENDMFMEFTKTYRIMTQPFRDILPAFDKNVNIIKFYGHSLGEADYSYFVSIFDAVDLYSSNVQLVFYYHDFDGHVGLAHKKEQVSTVYKLINHYGTTFQNQEHGKNLLHKLVLERRIRVINPEEDMYYG